MPKEIKKNRNFIILVLDFNDLNSRKLWNEQNFSSIYNRAQPSNLKYFSFNAFELGTSTISTSNENYIYTFDKFFFSRTAEIDIVYTQQIFQPFINNSSIRKNDFKEIFLEVFEVTNESEDSIDKLNNVTETKIRNNFKIFAKQKFYGINLSIEAFLIYKEEIIEEKKKNYNHLIMRIFFDEEKKTEIFIDLEEIFCDGLKVNVFYIKNNIKNSVFKYLAPQILKYQNKIEKKILKIFNFNGDRFIWN
ncbi:hypothetical protein GVAV_000361 [Gurleya vavrai]